MNVTWSSTDPRTGQRVAYGAHEAALLEAAYTQQQAACELIVRYLCYNYSNRPCHSS